MLVMINMFCYLYAGVITLFILWIRLIPYFYPTRTGNIYIIIGYDYGEL